MSPDDDAPAVAVAEPPAPPAPPVEVVPPPAQEQEPPVEGAPVAEPGATDETPSLEDAYKAIAELAKEDPKLAEVLKQQLQVETPEDALAEIERERAGIASARQYEAISQGYQQANTQAAGFAYQTLQRLQQAALSAAQKAALEADADKAETFDAAEVWPQFRAALTMAEDARGEYVTRYMSQGMIDRLMAHPAARHLSEQDRARLKAASGKPVEEWQGEVLGTFLDAALRAAPAEERKRARQEAEKDTKAAEKLAEVLGMIGGRRVTKGAPPANSAAVREQRVRDGTASMDEINAYLNSLDK